MRAAKMQGSRPFISLREATFRLGDRLVFDQTCWSFERDQHWAVIGPNGSGKSLFADALRGRLPLVGGDLRYHFSAPPGLSAEQAIGQVSFEERKASLHETVAQSRWNSLEEQGALHVSDFLSYDQVMEVNPFEVTDQHDRARPGFARRQRWAIELLWIGPLLERTLISLSNGERQRVQLARALCHPLRLLILDEPFVGLDAATREYFHGVLAQLMRSPLRVLLITTRPEDLPQQVTHVLRVEECQVVGAGPRQKLLRSTPQPASRRDLVSASNKDRHRPAPSVRPTKGSGTAGRRSPALVQLRQVTVRYGAATILHNLDWEVRAGQSWAVLGPNGSGKTTLLSLLLGDNPQAYSNQVRVFGRQRGSGESIWELKRHIGWVSPELHLHYDATVNCFEVVGSGFHETVGLFEPLSARQRAQVRHWLDRLGLQDQEATPLFGLSTGLQRMVLLARALVKRPRLLILDEPCQGLDAAHRTLFVRTVEECLSNSAVTALYVTHRADEIPPSIRRVLRLDKGRGQVEKR